MAGAASTPAASHGSDPPLSPPEVGTPAPRYDRFVVRGVHDRGGWPTAAPIDRREHELADWELLTDALVGALGREGVINVDELRRGIESMPLDEYERASYYERWLYSVEANLTEKGILAPGELDRRLAK
jgi:Nitrile hydratase beta subunit